MSTKRARTIKCTKPKVEPAEALELNIDIHGDVETFRGWCKYFLTELFTEVDAFSGKRPGVDSGWFARFAIELIKHKCIKGFVKYDKWGGIEDYEFNNSELRDFLKAAISEL